MVPDSQGSDDAEPPADPVHVDGAADLDDVVDRYDVVLVDFYADWCAPCQVLEPVVDDVAAETAAAVAKVDVDANEALAASFDVRGVPTLLLFDDGDPAERVVGLEGVDRARKLVDGYTA
jgi:thioredoxin 1